MRLNLSQWDVVPVVHGVTVPVQSMILGRDNKLQMDSTDLSGG